MGSRRTLVAIVLAALVLVVAPLALSRIVSQPDGREYVIVIPEGTAARVKAGEAVDVLPSDVEFALSDRLIFVNNDSATHRIGPFTVRPGQRLSERFSSVSTISGFCTLHPDARIDIRIRPV